MNLQRNQRKLYDYKVLLVDKMQHRTSKVNAMNERKNQLIDTGLRMNQTMQEKFY